MYYAVNIIFTLSFFCWTSVLKGGSDLFSISDSYCNSISGIKTMSMITSISFIVIYGLFKLPNIVFKSYHKFLNHSPEEALS